MNLIQRFKKLSLWNKIGVIGAIASIVGLFFGLIFIFFPKSPKINGDYVAGDKIINYGTFVKVETAKIDENNVVTEENVKDFSLRL